MQLLILFVTGVLIGSVHCDNQCFSSIFTDCAFLTVNPHSAKRIPRLCNHLEKQFDCQSEKAVMCRMGFSEEAKNVSEILKQMCTEGNAINTEFELKKQCFKKAVLDRKCNEPIGKIMHKIGSFKESVRGNKEICKHHDSYSRCIVESVEDNCGGPSKNFFSSIFDPMITFGQAVCDQLIATADENGDHNNVGLYDPYAIIHMFFLYA